MKEIDENLAFAIKLKSAREEADREAKKMIQGWIEAAENKNNK